MLDSRPPVVCASLQASHNTENKKNSYTFSFTCIKRTELVQWRGGDLLTFFDVQREVLDELWIQP